MPLVNYDVIGDDGEVQATRQSRSVPFGVVVDGQTLNPPITTQIEVENSGDIARVEDQCNNAEIRRFGSQSNWVLRIRGITTVTDRGGVLSLSRLMSLQDREVGIVSDFPIDGPILVSNTTITQSQDSGAKLKTVDMQTPETMMTFQMQLGQKESQNG